MGFGRPGCCITRCARTDSTPNSRDAHLPKVAGNPPCRERVDLPPVAAGGRQSSENRPGSRSGLVPTDRAGSQGPVEGGWEVEPDPDDRRADGCGNRSVHGDDHRVSADESSLGLPRQRGVCGLRPRLRRRTRSGPKGRTFTNAGPAGRTVRRFLFLNKRPA